MVYLPQHKALCTGDITFPLFPTFADSRRDLILDCLHKSAAMTRAGAVELVADGHADRVFRGAGEVQELFDRLIGDHLEFEEILGDLVHAEALTPDGIYAALTRRSDRPVVRRYLDLEFPHSPPSLQNVIANTLQQLGYQTRGPAGHQRFVPAG